MNRRRRAGARFPARGPGRVAGLILAAALAGSGVGGSLAQEPSSGGTPAVAEGRAGSPGDTLRARITVSPAVVQLGERVSVRVSVAAPDSASRLLAPPAPTSFGDIDVLQSASDAAGPDSLAWKLELALFQLGDQNVGALPFGLEAGGRRRPVALPAYLVTVEASIPADSLSEAGLRDIRGPMTTPLRWIWWRVLLAAGILAALGWGVWRWWRRRGGDALRVRPLEPSVPPEVRALRALDDLARDALPARGMIKEHYFRLSLILRGYVEERHRFPAVESTTDEIRLLLERRGLLPEARGHALLEVLDESDLVKFARFDPGLESADHALVRAREWIGASASAPVAAPGVEEPREVAV